MGFDGSLQVSSIGVCAATSRGAARRPSSCWLRKSRRPLSMTRRCRPTVLKWVLRFLSILISVGRETPRMSAASYVVSFWLLGTMVIPRRRCSSAVARMSMSKRSLGTGTLVPSAPRNTGLPWNPPKLASRSACSPLQRPGTLAEFFSGQTRPSTTKRK